MIKVDNEQQMNCQVCGKSFGCGANSDGCWCQDVEIKKETIDRLSTMFEKCLCKECLEKADKVVENDTK